LAGIAAGGIFVGCTTTEGAYMPQNTTKYDYENSSNFVLMDAGVQQSVTSSGIQETRLPDGKLQVAANIRNRETRRIQVQVQCEFKDAQGFAIDSTPWNTLILTENGQETVSFTSMNNQAQRYTVRVREAH
jgi:uncharacterized protein YcfL